MIQKRKATIGIEVHIELRTKSKMFCGCPADHFGVAPNTHTCPVCLGLPGALPVPNESAIKKALMIGMSLHCTVAKISKFDRKQYFYPDLPKGYQISQYDEPLCHQGFMETNLGKVGITRVHLEEDTGKLLHTKVNGKEVSLVDFNRSGVPLVEIVTDPDITSGEHAKEVTQKLQRLVRFLGVSDCDMEKGSMRLEANISWGISLGYKVEVKNLNSFRFIKNAIDYELDRQAELLKRGEKPKQETRGWDQGHGRTTSQRFKETEADYRYFPEPDIPPLEFSDGYLQSVRAKLKERPEEVSEMLTREFGLKQQYTQVLLDNHPLMDYAKAALSLARDRKLDANLVAGMIVNRKVDIKSTTPEALISGLIERNKAVIADETELLALIKHAMQELPKAVADYKAGKTASIAVLIGKVMQLSKGKADAGKVKRLLEIALR